MRLILASAIVFAAATAPALADPDLAKGETAFRKCMACHMVGPGAKVRVGPPLNGIVGRAWGAFPGFSYSADIKAGAEAGKKWDEANLNAYITNPKELAPAGKMAFAGIKNEAERADLIAYLAQFNEDGSKK